MGGEPPSSVMVAVRCRPFNQRELDQQEGKVVRIGADGYCALQPANEQERLREFSFDYTYDEDTLQTTVYENLGAPMLEKAFDGWNSTIFAYGQTGSGKSFSMTGSASLPGIIPQLNGEMFQRITASQAQQPEKKFLVTCSFMEIYNEVLYDLLDPSIGKGSNKSRKDSNIEIKEHPALGVYVQGLQEIAVDSHLKIEQLMQQGNDMRAVAATNMNATSSRSHSIFIIKISQKEVIAGQQKEVRATINLVDLAGSERVSKTGATGDKLKEGANINKSLSALGNVINALAEQSKKNKKVFIPYRNSKLTRVLQESLGGNSVTVMLAAISPAAYNFEETLNTLQYADRAKAIQLKARKNEQMTEVGKLKAEIEALKAQLLATGGGGGGGEMSEAARVQMQSQIDDYNLMLKQSFEEKERLAQEMERERREMLARQEEERAELQRKYEEERRAMLVTDSDHWVRMLLQPSRHNPQSVDFVREMEAIEGRRRELAEKLREQLAFINVLQNSLEKEALQYLEKESAGKSSEPSDEAVADAHDIAMKTLLEQMMIKMKNLREEINKTSEAYDELANQLALIETTAKQHLGVLKDGDGYDSIQLKREISDLELCVEFAAQQREKHSVKEVSAGVGLLDPLKRVNGAVRRGVEEELQTVSARLAGPGIPDNTTKTNMEKRVTVLQKELVVLADVAEVEDVSKLLHGLSQVLQGVVTRTNKRLTMRDKKKGEALAAKEQQVKDMRAEAEQLREKLYKENIALNDEVSRLLKENDELRSGLSERDQQILALRQDLNAKGIHPTGAAEPKGSAAANSKKGAAPGAKLPDSKGVHSSPAAGDVARRPASAGAANPFRVDVATLQSGREGGGAAMASLEGKLQIVGGQLRETEKQLQQMTSLATRVQEEKRYIEEKELVPLRLRAAKLEEELQQIAPDAVAKVDAEAPSVPPLQPTGPMGFTSATETQTVTMTVPEGAAPGAEVTITAPDGQQVTVTIPEGVEPGQPLEVQVPAAAKSAIMMTVPEGATAGAEVTVTAPDGQQVTLTIPEGVEPGQQLEVQVPASSRAQTVSMTVPEGATAGAEVTVTAPDGQQVTVTIPEGLEPGEPLEVQVPAKQSPVSALGIAPLRLVVDTRGPIAKETESAQVRSLHNERVSLTLQLATSAQATVSAQGREAELELELAKVCGERDAYARQLQGGGEVDEDGQLLSMDNQAQLDSLQAQLRNAQAKAVEVGQSSRHEKLKADRARMEAELGLTQLKEERLQLQEAALTAEEAALEAQQELELEKQATVELKEALLKADLRVEQLEQKVKLMESGLNERVEKLTTELEAAEARAAEAAEEVEALEEEKYGLVHDIEVLEEELEDANTHQKRYYEALMQKEDQLNRLKAQCAALTKAVEKLQYENELIELRNNPVGEELDVAHLHQETDELRKLNASKERELRKLKSELEAMQLTVEEESYEQSPGNRWKQSAVFEVSNENVPTINLMEEAPAANGMEDNYSRLARAREEKEAKAAAAAEAERLRLAAAAQQLEESEQLLRIQLQQEKEHGDHSATRIRQLEAHLQKQEREILGLISARDQFSSEQTKKEEELSEMQDNLYEVSQKLEEEQERVAELRAEVDKLRPEAQEKQKLQVKLRSIELELEDEREARRKAEQKLKQAVG